MFGLKRVTNYPVYTGYIKGQRENEDVKYNNK